MTQRIDLDQIRTNIRTTRRARGLSLIGLSTRLARIDSPIDDSVLSKIETGKRALDLDLLDPIAEALDTSLDTLLYGRDLCPTCARPEHTA